LAFFVRDRFVYSVCSYVCAQGAWKLSPDLQSFYPLAVLLWRKQATQVGLLRVVIGWLCWRVLPHR
jgi:hypothetical protein